MVLTVAGTGTVMSAGLLVELLARRFEVGVGRAEMGYQQYYCWKMLER